jgi:O-antigen/teichoic acid export membrane protein
MLGVPSRPSFGGPSHRTSRRTPPRMAQRTQRLIEAARRPLPEGTFAVGAGIIVAGLTAYGFQSLSFRALSKPDYSALNALWVFVFVLAPGVFLPLEQEVGRATADRGARGIGSGPIVRKAAVLGAWVTVGLAVLTIAAAAGTSLVDHLFEGSTGLFACIVIALFTYGFEHLARGALAGDGRFGPYGMILAAEGATRMVACGALFAAGVDEPVWYGLCLAVPPAIGSLVALRGQRGLLSPGPDAPWSEVSSKLGFLLFGSLLAQALSYAPFIGAQVLSAGKSQAQRDLVADFIVGLFLARIPILLYQAVQAALLPKLARLAASGKHEDFRNGLRTLLYVVCGVGILGVVGGATVGPFIGETIFGDKFHLGHVDLLLLAGGSGLFILTMTLAQALIALLGHAQTLAGWVVGIIVFVAVTAFASDELFTRVEVGSLAGASASAAVMGWMLNRRLLQRIPEGTLAAFVEQIEHEPLEI